MKTRFLNAIIHDLPGADFQSAAGESRRRFHVHSACAPMAPVPHAASPHPRSSEQCPREEASIWWRFASAWRKKPADNFAPAERNKKFFRCVTTSVASALLLCVAGCQSNGYVFPSKNDHVARYDAESSKASAVQMQSVTTALDPALLLAPTNLFTLRPCNKL